MSETAEIVETLKVMDKKLDNLIEWKCFHIAQHEAIGRDMTEVRIELFGNPGSRHLGLKSEVQTLVDCKKSISELKNFWVYILQALIISGVLSVVVWALKIFAVHADVA